MSAWELHFTATELILDFAVLSGLLVLATVLRRYVRFFQEYLIPNALIAGFAGLILGPEVLGWLHFTTERMGVYLYHLLALTFIGIGLQGTGGKRTKGATHVGFAFIMSYLVQIFIGLGICLLFFFVFNPDLIPALGMLLPLGYGMGPGIAFNVGQSWEAHGFPEAANAGLTISALGFLVAYFSGITIVNRGLAKGRSSLLKGTANLSKEIRTGFLSPVEEEKPIAGRLNFHGGAIDALSFHLALIGLIYLVTYGIAYGLAALMLQGGLDDYVPTLWSFNFIISNLLALLLSVLLRRFNASHVIDEGLTNRLTCLFTDFMITAAIMAISMSLAMSYAVPIVIMCLAGALGTYMMLKWVVPRAFEDHLFERFVGIYGEMTGTISSGLALLRVTDPEFKTPVALDLGLGSGMALVLGFPLLFIINLPLIQFKGSIEGYFYVLGFCLVYIVIIWFLWKRFGLKTHKVTSD